MMASHPTPPLYRHASPEPEALDEALSQFLAQIIASPARHARFLNTVSLLELLGSRKIMLSQFGPHMSAEALQHLHEETRHAHFYRRLAEKTAGRPLDYGPDNVVSAPQAAGYIQRLDGHISRDLGYSRRGGGQMGPGAPLPYLYVSAVVEVRALWFFRLYDQVLARQATGLSLKNVIAEELGHLDDMAARLAQMDPAFAARFEAYKQLEARLFARLLPAVLAAA